MNCLLLLCLLLTKMAVMTDKRPRSCPVCGRPARYHAKYCPRCWPFCNSNKCNLPIHERVRALKEALDEKANGFRCHYSGVLLDLEDPDSPLYPVFDHIVPGEPRLVICSRLVNDMKKDLTGDEFRIVVPAISDFLEKGLPVGHDIIGFVCWPRRYDLPSATVLGKTPPSPKGCAVCEMKRHRYSLYCDLCRHFIFHKPEHVARVAAMKDGWDRQRGGFICHYTGVLLDRTNSKSPWYMVFDHRFPGNKGHLAVCAAWVNGMKTYLTEEQFRAILNALAGHFRDGAPVDGDLLDIGSYKMVLKSVGRVRN